MKTMKIIITILSCIFLATTAYSQESQKVNIQIKVLDNEYMIAKGFLENKAIKSTTVDFGKDVVKVFIPNANNSITLEILNSDCKAYCTRVKRVRQLSPKDERLLKNFINKEKDNIFAQLKAKGLKL